MPRKPVPVFERTVVLPFGKLQLTVTGNPLSMTAKDRALFNQVVDQVEVLDQIVKHADEPVATAPAGSPAAAAADADRGTKH